MADGRDDQRVAFDVDEGAPPRRPADAHLRGRPRARCGRRGRARGGARVRDLRQRCPRLRRHLGPSDATSDHGARGGRGRRRRRRRGARLAARRPGHLRVDALVWRLPRLPRRPHEPLRPPGGARRVVPRLPTRRGLRGARCGTEQGARPAPGRAHVRARRLRRAARRCTPRRRARRQRRRAQLPPSSVPA